MPKGFSQMQATRARRRPPINVPPIVQREFVDHQAYTRSSTWKARKEKYFDFHDKACELCGSEEDIALHHQTYDRLGDERDEDLVPLCKRHHWAVHKFIEASGCRLIDGVWRYRNFVFLVNSDIHE